MVVLDTTVVNVSLPHIAGSLSATIDEATWALTSYLVGERRHPAHDGMAGDVLRAQAPADDLPSAGFRSLAALRPRPSSVCSSSFASFQGAPAA